MNLTELWNQLPQTLRENIVRILLAVLVFIIVWAARKVLAALVVAPLKRIAARTESRWDDVLLQAVVVPARILIIAFGLALGAEILQLDPAANIFVQHLIRTLVILALCVGGLQAVDILTPSSVRLFSITGLSISEQLLPILRTSLKLVVIIATLLVIIQEWGYDATGLITGLGIGGLAISLAAQDTIKNLFGFTTIVGDQPFAVGDFIKTNDVEGTVEHVGARSTRIRQMDQAYVTIPNSVLANAAIVNWSRLSKRWINMTLRITYDAHRDDIQALLDGIREMLKNREQVADDSVLVSFLNFGDAGMEILIRCYILQPEWTAFTAEREQINLSIMKIIEDLGLHIAFPARAVYIDTKSGAPASASASVQGGSQTTEENTQK